MAKTPTPTPAPTPTRTPSRPGGSTPSQDVSAADKAAAEGVPQGTATGTRGLTGVPLGTEIYIGQEPVYMDSRGLEGTGGRAVTAKTQYSAGMGMSELTQMSNKDRVEALRKLAQIPGIYPKGQAPTEQMLINMARTGEIGIRDVDAKALENVMRYADTVGVSYEQAINRFFSAPQLAADFFGTGKPDKGPKVTNTAALVAEITDRFQNTFDLPVSKDIAKKYAAEVQAAERRGVPLSAQQREDVLFKYMENASKELSKLSKGGTNYQPRGILGEYVRELREEYYNNGLPMDENKIYRLAVKSLRDPQELINSKQRIRQNAELVFPPLRDYIARGESVRDVLSPYMRLKANIFEINEEDVNPSDMYDVMEGEKLKNINDYKMSLYRSPEYKKTQGYFQRQLNDTRGLLQYLGIE